MGHNTTKSILSIHNKETQTKQKVTICNHEEIKNLTKKNQIKKKKKPFHLTRTHNTSLPILQRTLQLLILKLPLPLPQ